MSYELRNLPVLGIIHVWGYPVETRPYIPYEKKLDSRTISYLFIGILRGLEALGFTVLPLRT